VNRTLPNTSQQWRLDVLNWGAIHCLKWLLHCQIYFITSPFFLLLLHFVFLTHPLLPFLSSTSSIPSSILLLRLLSSLLFSTPLSPLVFLSSPSSFAEYHAETPLYFSLQPPFWGEPRERWENLVGFLKVIIILWCFIKSNSTQMSPGENNELAAWQAVYSELHSRLMRSIVIVVMKWHWLVWY